MKQVTVETEKDIEIVSNLCKTLLLKGKLSVTIQRKEPEERKRTLPQNRSLHLYCQAMADQLNDAGYTQRKLVGSFKEGFELPATMDMIKSIFREVGKAMYKKESTKDLTTIEIQDVYRVVDSRFGEITGVSYPWPSEEPPLY